MAADQDTFDLVVIGGGPGGYTAAIRAAQLGLQAAVVEQDELGGVCLNWGCIPTKVLLRQAEIYRLFQRAGEFGFEVDEVGFDWRRMIARSRQVADQLAKGVAYLMKKNQVQVFSGKGGITPTRKVEVRDGDGQVSQVLEGRYIIVATGGRPRSISGVEIDGKRVLSSQEAMVLADRPGSLAIVGAGAIGVEFAYFFNAFGTEVTLLEIESQVLPREDEEVARALAQSLEGQGIRVEIGVEVQAVEARKRKLAVRYRGKEEAREAEVDKVLMAVGVTGNVEGLGLEALGVRVRNGTIEVNGRLETSARGIYAIGDVIGEPQLAHAAAAEGVAAAEFIAGRQRAEIDRSNVPRCVYCQPQVASVGLSEKEAREAGHDVKVGRFPFTASGKARAAGETEGLVKLVFDSRYGELLGAAILGGEATELIAELGLARSLEATYEELLRTVHAHPTLSEGVMEAAGEAFGEALNL